MDICTAKIKYLKSFIVFGDFFKISVTDIADNINDINPHILCIGNSQVDEVIVKFELSHISSYFRTQSKIRINSRYLSLKL